MWGGRKSNPSQLANRQWLGSPKEPVTPYRTLLKLSMRINIFTGYVGPEILYIH